MSKRIVISFAAGLLFIAVLAGNGLAAPADATVAPNGDGQFKSVQDAINRAPPGRSDGPWVIHIKPGVYKELIYVQRAFEPTFSSFAEVANESSRFA